jgi:Na+-translocating ferredoxin:NAD+ oxidoreductase RnfD subunit
MNDDSQIISEFFDDSFSSKVKVNIAILIVTGTLNTILLKLQNGTYNLKDGLFQCNLIFLGQFFNLLIFYGRLFLIRNKKRQHFIKYKNKAMMRGKVIS